MIQIKKQEIPDILLENQQAWTENLIYLIYKYGGYDKIPENFKNEAVNKYRHEEIKTAVINITKGKCIFCESVIETVDYTNIEHFHPKALYPKFTFKWSNLFPACRKCNIPKGDTDTKKFPIVHPVYDEVEEYFTYTNLKITINENAPDKVKAFNTINICKLDRITLCRQHSDILFSFYEVEEKIKETNEHYEKLIQNASKLKLAANLLESINNLKEQSRYTKPHAGFLRFLIKKNTIIQNAMTIINTNRIDLGLTNEFDFEWNV